MYILDPTLDETATEGLIGQIEEFIKKQDVAIDKTDRWGKRRLAYDIGRHQEGFYVLSTLTAPPSAIAELERRLRVTDGVLRFISVRMDEDQAKLERRRARKASRDAARRARRGASASLEAASLEDQVEATDEAGLEDGETG
jgi:small subunit ribosomal protein S6